MLRLISLSTCLLLLVSVSEPAAAHRFVAALTVPDGASAQCAILSSDSSAGTASLKLTLETAGSQVASWQQFVCAPDGWQLQRAASTSPTIELNAGDHGFDQIAVSIPRGELPDAPLLRAQVFSLTADDVVADRTEPAAGVWLSSAGNPLGVPALRDLGTLALIGLLLAVAWAVLRTRQVAQLVGMVILTFGLSLGLGSRSAAELSIAPPELAWQDPGYDSTVADAALDLRRATIQFSGRDLKLLFAVNNLEPPLLNQQDRMLFIGNSLTSSNNLPGLLSRLAAQAGKQLDARAQTIGGSSLEDHFRAGNATREIAAGRYPVVVLQQGPSSLPENQIYLRTWTERFDRPIRAAGGRPLLYMVWPDRSRMAYFSDVRDSYRDAALAVQGAFAPAGETWLAAWALDPELAFYSNDDFHPTLLGSYVAALSVFCTVYQQSPEGLPGYIEQSNGSRTPLPPATALLLQRAAWDTYRREGLRGQP
ncbi:hypothetical protein [Ahniella affigens]|nr:hypothetical protein [Ahniella affigens]